MKNWIKRIALAAIVAIAPILSLGDTTTTRFGLTKPDVGSTNWGPKINVNYDIIDNAAALSVANTFTSSNTFNAATSFNTQVLFAAGSVGTPIASFAAAPTSGLFLGGTNLIGIAAGGSSSFEVGTSSVTSKVAFFATQGSGQIAVTTLSASSITATTQFLFANGTAGTPSIALTAEPTTGLYRGGAGILGFTSSGVSSVLLTPNNVQAVGGSAANPSFVSITDSNTGSWFPAADTIGWATGGTNRANLSSAQFDVTVDTFSFTGKVLRPTQPRYHVRYTGTTANVTGDGTTYTYTWPTELIDVGGNFAQVSSTYCFTAPITGVYGFHVTADISGLTTSHTQRRIDLITTSGGTFTTYWDGVALATTDMTLVIDAPVVAMTKGDIAYVTVKVSGSTKTVGVGSGSGDINYFMGELKN